jgi:hypothetical protein
MDTVRWIRERKKKLKTTHQQKKEKAIERGEKHNKREKSHSQAHRAHARPSPNSLQRRGKKDAQLHTTISLANWN